MQSLHSKQWEMAIAREFEQLTETRTFEWIQNIPEGSKAIGGRIIFRFKCNGNGRIVKHKSRIVAKGFSQIPRQDFNETFASVAKFSTLRTLLSIVAHEDFELHQIDMVGAYLQGNLSEEIYMEVPNGINVEGKEGWYWKLKKALYSLKQARQSDD